MSTTIATIIFISIRKGTLGLDWGMSQVLECHTKEQVGMWTSQAAGEPSPRCSEQGRQGGSLETSPFCRYRESWLLRDSASIRL